MAVEDELVDRLRYRVEDTSLGRYYYNHRRELDRDDGPAVEYANGAREWWANGVLHREGGPAIERETGHKQWWANGVLHREDGPAVEYPDGGKAWWVNGVLHREGGPAIEYATGTRVWFLNGIELTEEEFIRATQPAVELTAADIERLSGKQVK